MHEHLYIYPKLRLPFDDDSNSFEIGFDVREGDTLTIHYRDKEETIDLYQLYTENVKEWRIKGSFPLCEQKTAIDNAACYNR